MFDYPFIPDLPQWMEILGLGIIATIIGAVLVAPDKKTKALGMVQNEVHY